MNHSTCPLCKTPVTIKDDLVSCQNNNCIDFNLKYLQYEFNELCCDLAALKLIQDDKQ
jgi:hypothetical protein